MARPLRKVLKYRDQTGATLEEHTAHWAEFTWEAGPVIVTHKDGLWGVVQVWAVSVEEGKRVIRHAAEIAGVDPDTTGRWEISGTANPRYGRRATMAVKILREGYLSVTKRDGPSGLPDVAA
jgi:hypothetical protein